jgi:endogenous inhibitor of DNA gyrase (YacG/DUF329 family)
MSEGVALKGRALCPICATREAQPDFAPFCSKRCADVDLNRWLGGVYAIPVTEVDDEDGDAAHALGDGTNEPKELN